MRRMKLLALAPLLVMLAAPEGQAQVTVDVSKITCEQYILYKITDPKNIAMWLSGYYNAKRDNTIIDAQTLEKNVDKLKDYCLRNMNTSVMQAAETALDLKK